MGETVHCLHKTTQGTQLPFSAFTEQSEGGNSTLLTNYWS